MPPLYPVKIYDSEGEPIQNAEGHGLPVEIITSTTQVVSGELAGNVNATQLPNIPCARVKFKALISNAGNVYIGGAGVTKPDGATDATSGLELIPGDESGWVPVPNLNLLYRICDNAGDDLTYIALV